MSHEFYYTSAPQGLFPGSNGFCVVATTEGLPASIIERLEGLCGYRQIYPHDDPLVDKNPVIYSHLKLSIARKTYHLLSRIGYAGLDYTDRSNKLAHHVLLDREECPEGGPAWLASQEGFLESSWDGECRVISQGRIPPRGDLEPKICATWERWFGDAGWAGVVAERFLSDPSRLVYIVFDPGEEVLPLIVEASALIPPRNRWEITFSTYYTGQNQGLQCAWRAVVRDSLDAIQAKRLPDTLILDPRESLEAPIDGRLVRLARTGVSNTIPIEQPSQESPIEIEEVFADERSEVRSEKDDDGSLRLIPEISKVQTKIHDFPRIPVESSRPKMIQVPERSNKKNRSVLIPLTIAAFFVTLIIPFGFAWMYRRERRHFNEEISKYSKSDHAESSVVDQKLNQIDRPSEESKPASDSEAERNDRSETDPSTASTAPSIKVGSSPPKPIPEPKEKELLSNVTQDTPRITGFFDIKFERKGIEEKGSSESDEFDQEIESINLIGEKDQSIKDFKVNLEKNPDGESRKISIKGKKIESNEASSLRDNEFKEIGVFSLSENSKKIIFTSTLTSLEDENTMFHDSLKSCVVQVKFKNHKNMDKYLLLEDPDTWGLSFPKSFEQNLVKRDPVVLFNYPKARKKDFDMVKIRVMGVDGEIKGYEPEFDLSKNRIKIDLDEKIKLIGIENYDSLKSLKSRALSKIDNNTNEIIDLKNKISEDNYKNNTTRIEDLKKNNDMCTKLINLCDAEIVCDVYLTIGGRKFLIDIDQKKMEKSK